MRCIWTRTISKTEPFVTWYLHLHAYYIPPAVHQLNAHSWDHQQHNFSLSLAARWCEMWHLNPSPSQPLAYHKKHNFIYNFRYNICITTFSNPWTSAIQSIHNSKYPSFWQFWQTTCCLKYCLLLLISLDFDLSVLVFLLPLLPILPQLSTFKAEPKTRYTPKFCLRSSSAKTMSRILIEPQFCFSTKTTDGHPHGLPIVWYNVNRISARAWSSNSISFVNN